MNARRHIALGLFFLGVVGVLGYYTLFKTDVSLFGEKPKLVAYAEDGGGLRKGAPVLYAGVRWGEVASVLPDVDRPREERVRIDIVLDSPIRLFDDFTAQIEAASVLGGVQLSLDPGSPGAGDIDLAEPIRARQAPNVLNAVAELVDENRESIRNAISGIEAIVETARTGDSVVARLINDAELGQEVENAVSSISATFENTRLLTDELRGGAGTLGRIIYDEELYGKIDGIVDGVQGFVDSARGFMDDARTGEGILATLVGDGQAAGDLKTAMAAFSSAATKINEGDGTIARLINDGAIATSIEDAASSIAELARGFREGDGTIAKLFNDSRVYDNIAAFTDDLLHMSNAIREAEGTLGSLIYDDRVVRQLEAVFQTLQGSLEEAREAAPVSTFLGTLFLGF